MSQPLRPSQYITTFGPGALIETPNGPYILQGTTEVLQRIHGHGIPMEDIAIRDMRLQQGLLQGARIFKMPDSRTWRNFVYPTFKFPRWNLCVQHTDRNVIHRRDEGCPLCPAGSRAREESKRNKYAIRFLMACPRGHMDDVSWHYLIHTPRDGGTGPVTCSSDHYYWEGSGASLAAIRIRCPSCNMQRELSEIYSASLPCSGLRPENHGFTREQCGSSSVVVQRGSFSLRLPEVITSLTIPPLVSPIHRTLQRGDVQAYIDAKRDDGLSAEAFFRGLPRQIERNHIPRQVGEELLNTPWPVIEEAILAIDAVSTPRTRSDYLRQEHEALMDVAETGFPPYPAPADRRPGEPVSFQVDRHAIRRDVSSPNGHVFRVMPIERLRVVIVQTGYRRVHYTGPRAEAPTSSRGVHPLHPGQSWIPGVEQFGEGVYIDLDPRTQGQAGWYPRGRSADEWDRTVVTAFDPNDLIRWNALSVWWHSFSHRLINAMSLHSGYSSTAIRERVYLTTGDDGRMYGGVLLYTTQPGGDGTMGGLTSLVHQFENIIRLSLNGIDRCSNDPLCENAEIDPVSKLGAACYSCEMVSETSCEHYNGNLNRRILLENLP